MQNDPLAGAGLLGPQDAIAALERQEKPMTPSQDVKVLNTVLPIVNDLRAHGEPELADRIYDLFVSPGHEGQRPDLDPAEFPSWPLVAIVAIHTILLLGHLLGGW